MVTDFSNIDRTSVPQPGIPKPPVWKWYVVYCVFLAILYLLFAVAGFVIFFAVEATPSDVLVKNIVSIAWAVIGTALFIPFAMAPFLPPKPWVWIYGIVLIAVGMTSVCTLPASIALLIFWIKPETKKFFGRTT